MLKNSICNIFIGMFLLSGIYNISACIFNPTGLTDGYEPQHETTTDLMKPSTTMNTSDTDTVTTIIDTTLTTIDVSNTNTGNPPSTTEELSTTASSSTNNFTSSSSSNSTDFDLTTSSSSPTTNEQSAICGNELVELNEDCDIQNLNGTGCEDLGFEGGGLLQCDTLCKFDTSLCYEDSCGNCILEPDEECDPCIYEGDGLSSCILDGGVFGKCVINFPNSLMYPVFNGLIQDMDAPLDKGEADLFCKIKERDLSFSASSWNTNVIGFSPSSGYLLKNNNQNKGTLLKSISVLTNQILYYFDYEDIPFKNNKDQQFTYSCVQ